MSLRIDVCYGLADGASFLAHLDLREGATVREAIEVSGVLKQHPEIDLSTQKVGVFGKAQPLDTALSDFDRVEIYRPLKVDPKTARLRRVAKTRKAGSIEGRKWQSKDSR
ncbi:RnfH family protein [Caballeronia sp. LP006]|jgi:putative ubiquitin-RnfH superfamily antitoxin RatB of RatAB toxin-antitoxin module|uniref:RnfH family protein n=1 Tax=unclassified Caballeronia TaxID=2646786 RepID=UPI001FD5B600|nr:MULTISPECIES: RnfH family protein [unclassified Caballeronia]MDR5771612.1 RnfH family protein [Caballeronia sp. LZ002]MDR5805397.1 RnfH family protein [Caballeronia sp. LZ001]MDR5831066.1 RnfH family protein [Caballeronia sp. LP006]MDR5847048.1 RnfH family protein [Caballeronia sp. LZ003]